MIDSDFGEAYRAVLKCFGNREGIMEHTYYLWSFYVEGDDINLQVIADREADVRNKLKKLGYDFDKIKLKSITEHERRHREMTWSGGEM